MTADAIRKSTLWAVPMAAAVNGLLLGAYYRDAQIMVVIDWCFKVLIWAALVIWCHADAVTRNFQIGRGLRLGLLFVLPIAFPYYLFSTRGIKAFITLGLVILFGLLTFGVIMAGAITTGGWPFISMIERV